MSESISKKENISPGYFLKKGLSMAAGMVISAFNFIIGKPKS